MDGIKLAGSYTVATAQTAVTAACLTSATGIHRRTGAQSIILGHARTKLAGSITTHNGHHRVGVCNGHTQQVGHLAHHIGSAHGAHQSLKRTGISPFHQGIGHTRTSGESTAATIGTGQKGRNLSNTGVFLDSKLLGAYIENHRRNKGNGSKYDDCC